MKAVEKNGYTTFWTNDFGKQEQAVALEALKEGKQIRVDADCIGHTRTAMVLEQARLFFERVGATAVEVKENDLLGYEWKYTFYKL